MPILVQGFDGPSLPSDWVIVNNSTPGGSTTWFPGNLGVFGPYAGASYAAANFNSAPFGGAISDWFLSPVRPLANGYTVSFAVRDDDVSFMDTLQIRLSTSGTSTNVGTTPTSLGDFGTLLLNLSSVSRLPLTNAWTQYTVELAGITGITTGRIGFRYVTTNTDTTGDYIGLDSVVITAVPEPESALLLALGLAAMVVGRRRRESK